MSYSVFYIAPFEKQLKRLSKKFPSLKKEFSDILTELKNDPFTGTAIGNDCYKIRMAIASKGKGKSGGARIITCVKVMRNSVYLLSIYDKSEQDDIPDKNLFELLKLIP